MKNKTKILLVIAGLLIVCVVALFGIKAIIYKGTDETVVTDKPEDITEVVTDLKVEEVVVPEKIEVNPEDVKVNSDEQKLQETPEKPEEPTEAPELKDDSDITDPDEEPEYKDDPEPKPEKDPEPNTTPDDNKGHEGEIYVEGFGWLPDDGPGSQTIYDPDMYMSGEKVGDM